MRYHYRSPLYKGIINEQNGQLFASKPDNLEEMDIFFEKYYLPLVTKVSSIISRMAIFYIFINDTQLKRKRKIFTINKTPELDRFTSEFYHIFNKEIVTILYKIFHLLKKEMLLNSFYEGSITITKSDKDIRRKHIITDHYLLRTKMQKILKESYQIESALCTKDNTS